MLGAPRSLARTLAAALAALCLLAGCAHRARPVVEPLRDATVRTPVVIVPGIAGTKLRDPASGRVEWGAGGNLFCPRDGGYRLALPIVPLETATALEPFAPVFHVRLAGLWKIRAYGELRETLEANGYRTGDLGSPRAGDTLFFFSYDWRRSVVEAALELARQLEAVRDARGTESLEVALVCQSTGGAICRYLAKYGGTSLDAAEAGEGGPPPGIEIERLVLLGTANGGAVRTLHEMHRGRQYVAPFGRPWRPEVLFTFPSLYESLPTYRDDVFVREDGRALDVKLFDPDAWVEHGWSAFGEDSRRRLAERDDPRFGDETARIAFLGEWLERARRLDRLLRADPPGYRAAPIHALQASGTPTPDRALLVDEPEGSRLYFAEDRRVRKRPALADRLAAPGDGHATEASQAWLSPKEREALRPSEDPLDGRHFAFILDPATQRALLEALAE